MSEYQNTWRREDRARNPEKYRERERKAAERRRAKLAANPKLLEAKRAKQRAAATRRRAANPEKAREKSRRDSAALRARDPERVRAALRKSYQKNVEQRRQDMRNWRAADPEKARKLARESYAKHGEQRRTDARNARAADPEKFREIDRRRQYTAARIEARRKSDARPERREQKLAWLKANPEYVHFNAWLQKYRRKQAMPWWADQEALRRVFDERPPGMHIDHRIPITGKTPDSRVHNVCGLHIAENLQYLTPTENISAKRSRISSIDMAWALGQIPR